MSDTSGHVAPQRDDLHTLTLRELELQVAAAGVLISRRQLMRHCEAGTFDAKKLPATNNVKEWFIAPTSVDKGVADIKTLQEHRARRDASRRDTSGYDASETPRREETGGPGHVAPRPSPSGHDVIDPDTVGHVPTQRDASESQPSQKGGATEPAIARHGATDLNIFEHPYVKRLENQIEKWEGKYHEQVRRTEEIQLKSQQQIIELQRMTAIGQSETLADFMLRAKEWILGQGSEVEKREADTPAS